MPMIWIIRFHEKYDLHWTNTTKYIARGNTNDLVPDLVLAAESHLPIDEVAQLYASELEKLAVGAHVTGFLPIFAIRNVREMLEQRAGA